MKSGKSALAAILGLSVVLLISCTKSSDPAAAGQPADAAAVAAGAVPGGPTPIPGAEPAPGQPVKPYRTFITIQRYVMDSNGEPSNPVSNVRIETTFPNQLKVAMPEGNQWWPIGNGQVQEIDRTYELPWAYIQKDGFKFEIQMFRKGSLMLPCKFEVTELSQFNRSYVCHTDLAWQNEHSTPPEKLDKEGIQVRVFTDLNSKPNEVPTSALALK